MNKNASTREKSAVNWGVSAGADVRVRLLPARVGVRTWYVCSYSVAGSRMISYHTDWCYECNMI